MKKYINRKTALVSAVSVIALLFAVSCSSGSNGSDNSGGNKERSALQVILERGTIRVGTTGDFNPMSFKDSSTGEYAGYDIDLVKQLASDMGVEVEWVATDWKNLVTGIASGKYDITTGASYNMGRARTAGYTLPVVDVGTVPLTLKKNAGRFSGWDSINKKGVKVAATLGTVFEEQARNLFPDAEIRTVEAPARDYQELLAGRADISVTSNIEASQLIKTYKELAIADVDGPRYGNVIGLLVPQDDEVLKNYIDVWIMMKEKSGFIQSLKDKWLSLK